MPNYQIWNHVYNIACILCAIFAALPPTVINVLPTQVKPYIVGIAGLALWLKSNINLFTNPDGTDGRTAYVPPSTQAK
jgi:hypothetical protein